MTRIGRFLSRFLPQTRGNVAIITALVMVPLTAAVGGGVDFANILNARQRLQDATDGAAIAAALVSSGTTTDQKSAADKAFSANLTDGDLAMATGSLGISTSNNVTTMSYSSQATIKTYVLGMIGISTIPIHATAKAGVSINSAEIAFVLDNTGSMAQNSKMTSLKSSLDSVLASLLDSNGNNVGKTKVALVPFDTQVALNNVSSMSGYAGNFTSVSNGYTCTGLSTAQCSAVTDNYPDLCNSITNNWGVTAGTSCAANIQNYTKVSNGYYYVYSSTYFANPNYGCSGWNCNGYSSYRYITYYRVTAYSLGSSAATPASSSSQQGYYTGSAAAMTPSSVGYSNYSQYSGSITYGLPNAGGLTSGSTTDIKDNNTITSNDDLLGVGTANWTGCVIDRVQPYDTQSDAPVLTNTSTLYPAAKCATNSLLSIMDLTTDIATARTYAAKMTPAGNTNITIGVQWGMEVLTPTAPFSNGGSFTDPAVNKYMIVLTDGLNTQNRWTTTASQIDARTALACTNAKKIGITVFTIRLQDGNSDMLQACATNPAYYYNLSNASQINGALGSIMTSIKKIRLTQ